jgi:hypothetical protein
MKIYRWGVVFIWTLFGAEGLRRHNNVRSYIDRVLTVEQFLGEHPFPTLESKSENEGEDITNISVMTPYDTDNTDSTDFTDSTDSTDSTFFAISTIDSTSHPIPIAGLTHETHLSCGENMIFNLLVFAILFRLKSLQYRL